MINLSTSILSFVLFAACNTNDSKPTLPSKMDVIKVNTVENATTEPAETKVAPPVPVQSKETEVPKKVVRTTVVKKIEIPVVETPIPAVVVSETVEVTEVENTVSIPKVDFSKVYGSILSMYVSSSGKVNYKGLKGATELVGQAIEHFQSNTPKDSWSKNEELAYWINAYNLFTLKLVIDNYPVKSIKDIAGGKPWDKKFIQLDGKNLSLNDIENGIIRKKFNEPRIHFAVNCASISCPKLANKEYTKDNLNTLLTVQTKAYLADKKENTITESSLKISNIFNWYKDDFNAAGGVNAFISKYSGVDIKEKATVTYQDYNWSLNE